MVPPQPPLKVQQTPNPDAQDPTESPLRLEHSDAVRQDPYWPVRLLPTQGSFGKVTMLKTFKILAAAEESVWFFLEVTSAAR